MGSFAESASFPLAGNEAIRRQLSGGQPGHAYIISGPKGSGRHTLARYIAQTLVCSADGARPCGRCEHCRKAVQGIHPDIILTDEDVFVGKGATDRARDLRSDAYIVPNEAAAKVYILHFSAKTDPRVCNIFLKVLEEGPDYAAFLLITENAETILQTIRSRCEELTLRPVTREEAVSVLASRRPELDHGQLEEAVDRTGGYIGAALDLLGGAEKEDTQEGNALAERFLNALADRNEAELAALMAANEKLPRLSLQSFCDAARDRVCTALTASATGKPDTLSEKLGAAGLLGLEEVLREAQLRLQYNAGSGHLMGWLTVSALQQLSGRNTRA